MSKSAGARLSVNVQNTKLEIQIEGPRILINGVVAEVDVEYDDIFEGKPFTLVVDQSPYEIYLQKYKNLYRVFLNGRAIDVTVEDERTRQLRQFVRKADSHEGRVCICAPMPGLIAAVMVDKGETVKKGQPLLIIEAMKMENEIRATSSGVVARIAMNSGQAVEKDTVLMEIESQARLHP